MVQRDGIDPGVDAAAGEQRGKRGRESDARRVLGEVQRLDAEPVAAEQHPAAVALDDREGEHAVQALDEPVAPVVVGLEQHLGVAVGEEPVAVLAQLATQLLVVVDAAVPRDGQPQIGVDHRLRARFGQIDDLQATMAERDPALRPHARRSRDLAAAIASAMAETAVMSGVWPSRRTSPVAPHTHSDIYPGRRAGRSAT